MFAGATEPVITGAGLLGFASGWALLGGAHDPVDQTSRSGGPRSRPPCMAATGVALLASRPATAR